MLLKNISKTYLYKCYSDVFDLHSFHTLASMGMALFLSSILQYMVLLVYGPVVGRMQHPIFFVYTIIFLIVIVITIVCAITNIRCEDNNNNILIIIYLA